MNKKLLIFILLTMIIGGKVFADVVTTQRRVPKKYEINREVLEKNVIKDVERRQEIQIPKTAPRTTRLVKNIKTCKPYREQMSSDYLGMNFIYEVKIDGWVNNKCQLNFTANTQGASSNFSNLYGIDISEAQVNVFAPKVKCRFTKEQLDYVGDSILQEEERNRGARNNMLKDANDISIDDLTLTDMKLLDVVINQQACQIINTDDLNNIMQNFMQNY